MGHRPCFICGKPAAPPTLVKRRRKKKVAICFVCVCAARNTGEPTYASVLRTMIELKIQAQYTQRLKGNAQK